jgi:hypothetical protein
MQLTLSLSLKVRSQKFYNLRMLPRSILNSVTVDKRNEDDRKWYREQGLKPHELPNPICYNYGHIGVQIESASAVRFGGSYSSTQSASASSKTTTIGLSVVDKGSFSFGRQNISLRTSCTRFFH